MSVNCKKVHKSVAYNDLPRFIGMLCRITRMMSSFNTYDSLGEIMEALGDRAGAIKNYSRSLELNPKNDNAAGHLKNLKAQ